MGLVSVETGIQYIVLPFGASPLQPPSSAPPTNHHTIYPVWPALLQPLVAFDSLVSTSFNTALQSTTTHLTLLRDGNPVTTSMVVPNNTLKRKKEEHNKGKRKKKNKKEREKIRTKKDTEKRTKNGKDLQADCNCLCAV